jgi:uncharacterized LabA/DUF88 family protein
MLKTKFKKEKNYAYIDGANLHRGVISLGWELDYARFRIWLKDKYKVEIAYLFLGLIPKYKSLYLSLQKAGFILVFKEVIYDDAGKPKGNCDADLVLQAACDAYEEKFNKAVIVSSDGDYSGLVKFLLTRKKLKTILSPLSYEKCSILLKRTNASITYINDQRSLLKNFKKEKAPDEDETS